MQQTKKAKSDNFFVAFIKRNWMQLAIIALLLVMLWITTDTFMKINNIMTVFRQSCVNGLIATGLTCVLIIGCIDLSVGSTVAAAGVLVVSLNSMYQWNLWLAMLVTIIMATVIGWINGYIRAKTLLPPFIITLAMQQTIRGLAYIITDGYPVLSNNQFFNDLGGGSWPAISNAAGEVVFKGVPKPFYVLVVFLVIVGIILGRTRMGRHMYAVGGNMEAAKHSGISYTRVVTFAYAVCGFLAGVAGIIMAARMASGQPTIGMEYNTDAIASAVIGGTAFGGGFGTIPGTFLGALIIAIINSGMTHLKIDSYWQMVVKGILILAAVYIDSVKGTFGAKKQKAQIAAEEAAETAKPEEKKEEK